MSHTDNTERKFDKDFPEWLRLKLWIEDVDPEIKQLVGRRQARKRQWRKEIEIDLD